MSRQPPSFDSIYSSFTIFLSQMTTAAKQCYDLLSEGLTQASVNPSKHSWRTCIQNAEASQTLEQFESLGKIVPQLISPFLEVWLILTLGYQLSQQVTPTDPAATEGAPLPQEAFEENKRFRSAYKKLIVHMPGFNPDAFIAKCNSGPCKILHSDWLTFLYDNNDWEYDRANPEEGLFRGMVLIQILRHLLIGPGAALRLEQKQTRHSNAQIIGASTINAHLIVYAACLARFMLNNSKEWDHMDFQFDASAFYDRIINYFDSRKDDDSVIELLAWFQHEVFTGRSPTVTNEKNILDSEDEAEDEDEDA
ncbi:hypothetical protein BDN71DRAFT_1508019 [Pleurotus eryngii]|uniref:Uncharacterized protein n=1 Tax=Pleurotus eryngii TaxID=5323 RepID=A0A9P6D7H5_PLEER|nr:hypothetical protein BDN71DRAFT_1508019 [Pleurotus eryngii]